MLVGKVEVRTKRPRSKSTKALYFSSLTLLMAAASGRVAARQKACYSRRSGFSWRRQAAAGGRVAADFCRKQSATFKVDEGPVLVDEVVVRTKRPRRRPISRS